MLNCGVAEPSRALAAVPKVLARRYRGTIRCRRFAQYPSPSSVLGNGGRNEAPVTYERAIWSARISPYRHRGNPRRVPISSAQESGCLLQR